MMQEKITIENLQQYGVQTENIRILEEIDSTNAEAKRQALGGMAGGSVIIAHGQTAGRGRMGRSFHSPAGGGIYLSFLLRPSLMAEDAVRITTAASVAVAQSIFAVTGRYPDIKWVNDLYLDGKKICGILAEMVQTDQGMAVVLGIGINTDAGFPEELQAIAGNLSVRGISDYRNRLVAELVKRILPMNDGVFQENLIEEYRKHSMVLGKTITIVGENTPYLVKDIGEDGQLILVDNPGNVRELSTGEISIRLTDSLRRDNIAIETAKNG